MAQIISEQIPTLDGQPILAYGPIVLQIVRMEEWFCEPENDWSGVDTCYNHIIIGCRAIVNPYATATARDPSGAIISRVNPTGNRAGVTMADLQQVLMAPRQSLQFQIGPDIVVSSPLAGAVCDAKNGPKPLACRILEVKGTKTAVIYFRIETWTAGAYTSLSQAPVVVSNRWAVEASVDDNWMTTLVTRGRMRVRTDALQARNPATPDIFRGACLPLPVPDGFKRGPVNIIAKEDGTELLWACTDQQKSLNLINGADLGACAIEGHFTTGTSLPYKNMKDYATQVVGDHMRALTNPFALLAPLMNVIPDVTNSFYIKVTGPPPRPAPNNFNGAIRKQLLKIGIGVALDRFQPLLPNGFNFANGAYAGTKGGLVSLYATVSIQDVAVELRGEVLGSVGQIFDPVGFGDYMNLSDDMTGANPLGPANPYQGILNFKGASGSNPNPPNANTSRGTFIGGLLEQALLGQYAVPPSNAPSVGSTSVDVVGGFQ